MFLIDFLVGIGRLLGKALGLVKSLVSEELLQQAIALVLQSAVELTDNASRREWAVQELISIAHVSESVARLAVELAVQSAKAGETAAAAAASAFVLEPATAPPVTAGEPPAPSAAVVGESTCASCGQVTSAHGFSPAGAGTGPIMQEDGGVICDGFKSNA